MLSCQPLTMTFLCVGSVRVALPTKRCDTCPTRLRVPIEAAAVLRNQHEAGVRAVVDSLRPGIAEAKAT